MLIEQQIRQYQALDRWFQSPLGLFIAQEFTNELKPFLDYLCGDALLQLGTCGDNRWLNTLKFKRKWIASPFTSDNSIDLTCSLNHLPLVRNSLDCIFAPLTLEPFGTGFGLIDELDRVLKPMGFIVFLSINPWSLWGAAMKSGLLDCVIEHKMKLWTPFNLNRIFLQRGYRQCSLSNFGYIPPINSQSLIKKLTFLNEIGKMLWPFPSGFYCYIAQKHEYIIPALSSQRSLQLSNKKYKSPLQPATNQLFV